MQSNVGKLQRKSAQSVSIEEMNRAIQELPEYKDLIEKHLNI